MFYRLLAGGLTLIAIVNPWPGKFSWTRWIVLTIIILILAHLFDRKERIRYLKEPLPDDQISKS